MLAKKLKITAAFILSVFLLSNGLPTLALAANEKNYDPFAVETIEKAPQKKTTFSERLKERQGHQEKQTFVIDNVLPGHLYIPKDTKFRVELIQDVSSKNNKTGEEVNFKILENVIINNVIIIPKDTIGIGYVYEARKAGGLGRKGKLSVAGREIRTVNNIKVPLRWGLQGHGNTDGGAGVVVAAVSIVGGLFMKGSNITFPAGTDFEVIVKNNVDLMATPENLAEVMNPKKVHGLELQVVPR